MTKSFLLLLDSPRRVAYAVRTDLLRAVIPPGHAGTYVLLKHDAAMYVGRSDTCVLTRLCQHELLPKVTHVTWEPSSTPERAYRLEAAWFHQFRGPNLLNQVHPARPTGYKLNCPFCATGDTVALARALPRLQRCGTDEPVVVDPKGGFCKN